MAGASGNPRALLAPKMTPIAHVAEHLHSIGYLYSGRCYQQFDRQYPTKSPLFTATGALDLLHKANITTQQIAEYPNDMATTLDEQQARDLSSINQQSMKDNLYLPQAGLVNPQALAQFILTHPRICYQQRHIVRISQKDNSGIELYCQDGEIIDCHKAGFEKVVIATAYNSHLLDARIFDCRKIRGQLSWFTPSEEQLAQLPKVPLKYGGYCATFTPQIGDETLNPMSVEQTQFLLGASFVRNQTNTDIRLSEHQINKEKLIEAIPELDNIVTVNKSVNESDNEMAGWQARVGIRAQTPDYHPIVGQIDEAGQLWTICAMGSKGFAFAPICAEALADMMTGRFAPLSADMLARLAPQRKRLQTPLSD